jgi:predicted amidohydrolase YtcJ
MTSAAVRGAIVPGLHDHHIHLLALTAARQSVDVGAARSIAELTALLRAARVERPAGWLRAVGWIEAVGGALDRRVLDEIAVGPVRVQDHSGTMWFVDSAGLRELGLASEGPRGDGRLFRDDHLVRTDDTVTPAEVRAVADELWQRGVTSITDASVNTGPDELALLAAAAIPQRLTCMTGRLDVTAPDGIALGPMKVLLDDDELPPIEQLAARVAAAHAARRSVAVHCVTRVQLLVALEAGLRPGDRVEHGAVVPTELLPRLAGITVVTQPGFVAARGDVYLDEVDPVDQPWLYRVRGLLEAGIEVRGSTDAPFGPADPWVAMRAAVDRRAPSGRQVAADEAVDAEVALRLFADDSATLLLDRPWDEAVRDLADVQVSEVRPGSGPPARP